MFASILIKFPILMNFAWNSLKFLLDRLKIICDICGTIFHAYFLTIHTLFNALRNFYHHKYRDQRQNHDFFSSNMVAMCNSPK